MSFQKWYNKANLFIFFNFSCLLSSNVRLGLIVNKGVQIKINSVKPFSHYQKSLHFFMKTAWQQQKTKTKTDSSFAFSWPWTLSLWNNLTLGTLEKINPRSLSIRDVFMQVICHYLMSWSFFFRLMNSLFSANFSSIATTFLH